MAREHPGRSAARVPVPAPGAPPLAPPDEPAGGSPVTGLEGRATIAANPPTRTPTGPVDGPVGDSGGERRGRSGLWHRRRTVIVGVALAALVAIASSMIQVVRERERLARLDGVPGVVSPIVGPVNELWATDRQPDLADGREIGGVLVDTWSASTGTVVRGVDAQTGIEIWSRALEPARSHASRCVVADGPVSGADRAVLVCLVVDAVATSADAQAAVDGSSGGTADALVEPTRVHLDVLDPRTGAVLSTLAAAPTVSIAAMGADVVTSTALTGGAEVVRVDPRTGHVAWTVDVTSPTVGDAGVRAPTVQVLGEHVVVDGGAQVWDLSDAGVVLGHWSGLPTATTWSIWRTTGGHLLRATFAPFGGDVTVTDLATGVRIVTSGTVRPLVGVDDGSAPDLLLVGGSRLTAWDLATGAQRWQVDGAADSVVVLGGTVYSVTSGALRAQDAETGTVRWTRRSHYGPTPSLQTDGQSLYISTLDPTLARSTLRAVNPSDGSIIWTSPLTGTSVSLLELGGRLFTTTPGGRLTALG